MGKTGTRNKAVIADAVEQTYRDTEPMINKLSWLHHRKIGGDFEEIKAQANLLFMIAYNTTDDSSSSFITWLYTSIKYGLMSWTRSRTRRDRNHRRAIEDIARTVATEHQLSAEPSPLHIEAKYNESETIRTLLDLIFHPPEIIADDIGRYDDPAMVRETIKEYLEHHEGWSRDRIRLAFKEVRRLIDVHQAISTSD